MSLPAEISGKESPAGDGSALDALIDFYRSFDASDLNALAGNWADGEAPSMDNPIGGIRRGWPAIREGYAKLFSGPAIVRVAFHDFVAQGNNDFHLFVDVKKATVKLPPFGLSFEFVRLGGSSRCVACGGNSITMGLSMSRRCSLTTSERFSERRSGRRHS
jgi:hypothetical protein